jgi:hypothetical protein
VEGEDVVSITASVAVKGEQRRWLNASGGVDCHWGQGHGYPREQLAK